MTADAFERYLANAVVGYAKDNVDSGRWPKASALERSADAFQHLLPQGLDTAHHYLMEITNTIPNQTVGILWFFVEEKFGTRTAFIYDIEVEPQFRRQGHAAAAIAALEKMVHAMGVSGIGLHVFAHNDGAQQLYQKLGFRTTGSNMIKNVR
jgi:ribosomal protein S18 acetylase RimI-like enzyme